MANKRIIVDLGKRKKAAIRKLTEGKGKLVAEVDQCISELKANNTLEANAQPVVIVLRESKGKRKWCPTCTILGR